MATRSCVKMATRSCGENGLIPSVHNSRALSAESAAEGGVTCVTEMGAGEPMFTLGSGPWKPVTPEGPIPLQTTLKSSLK